jgi:DNA-binding response OmpR family regulator
LSDALGSKRARTTKNLGLITAHDDDGLEGAAKNAGAREFLRKPFDISEFLTKFHRMLRV